MKTLIIKRDQWLRGEGYKQSWLYRERDNKFCCLGFLGLAVGYSKEDFSCAISGGKKKYIGTMASPGNLVFNGADNKWPADLLHIDDTVTDSSLSAYMMSINDDENTTDEEKIELLEPLFNKIGYTLKLED